MNAIDLILRLHQHRQWANHALLETAAQLTLAQLKQSYDIGQGSIWHSLTHLYAAEYVWLEALLGNDDPLAPGDIQGKLPGNQMASGAVESLPELRDQWLELDQRWQAYLGQLDSVSLSDNVYKVKSATGHRVATRRSDILLHVCTHAQYTTAQVVNMFRQAGIQDLPDTMLITLARQTPTS